MIQLVSRSSKGKIRVLEFDLSFEDDHMIITRFSFQYNGKKTQQPSIYIYNGKAKRTLEEQGKLQYESLIKHAVDKGYKPLNKDVYLYSIDELNDIIGNEITGNTGAPKPMLCKQETSITDRSIFDKEYYISRKINGVRCLIYLGSDGKLHTSSRGAINYDVAIKHILENPFLLTIYQDNPWLIMDGEIYKHGWSLNKISGICRKQELDIEMNELEFYWYDIVDTNHAFYLRWAAMQELAKQLKLSFSPLKDFENSELKIQLVPQLEISGFDAMKIEHDKYVQEGWEGAVIRLKTSKYTPNGRTSDMIKIKKYDTISCRVIGIEQGLRQYDDMVFICQMPDSDKTFKAKPVGDHNMKVDYTDHFDIYNGHMADIKYFALSAHGVVEQPTLVCFRWDLD